MSDPTPADQDLMTLKQQQKEQLQLRRTLAYRLRTERHLTFAAITRVLAAGTLDPATGETVQFQVATKTVIDDYHIVLRDNGYVTDRADVELHRAEELEKCDALEAAYYPEALKGDVKSANVVLRVMRLRQSLLGLTQVQVSGPGGGPIPVQVSISDEALVGMVARARERDAEAPSMN